MEQQQIVVRKMARALARAGLVTAFVVSLLLAAQFVPKFIRTGKVMPAGLMSILSVIGIIVALVAWLKK